MSGIRPQVVVLLALLFTAFTLAVDAATKTVDLRTNPHEPGYYELRFIAIHTEHDHAYVGFVAEDTSKMMSISSYVGFYPARAPEGDKAEASFEFVVKGVEGALTEEDRSTLAKPAAHQLTVRLNRSAYRKAEAVRDRWKESKTYRYGINDCVSFANQIAQAAGVKTPSTLRNPDPLSYVEELVASN